MVGLLMGAEKKKGTGRTTTAIQIDMDLARMAAVVASHQGITQSALISPVLRQFLTAQYSKVSQEIQKEMKSGSAGKRMPIDAVDLHEKAKKLPIL